MYFAVLCHDKADSVALRAGIRPSHLKYLAPHLEKILFAGPLLDEDGETSVGGLIIIDCLNLAAAKAFADNDPYALGGLFEKVEARHWRKVISAHPDIASTSEAVHA